MREAVGLRDVVWSAGAEVQIGHSSVDIALPLERREGEPLPPYDPKDTTTHFHGAVWFPDFAAWTSAAATFGPADPDHARAARRLLSGGPRELAVQPRSELQIKLSDTLTLAVQRRDVPPPARSSRPSCSTRTCGRSARSS